MRYLFEVSWEVCNKVGGIHTVLRSKAPQVQRRLGDGYFVLGPLLESSAEFTDTDEPIWNEIRGAVDKRGLKCRFGRWEIDGRPKAILVDFKGRYDAPKLLFSYWQEFGVDSIAGSWDYTEPVLFSTACGEVIEAIHEAVVQEEDNAVAHFHEWMCGGGLLHLKKTVPEIGTVFTTHATILGRSMAHAGVNIYSRDEAFNPQEQAKRFGVSAKHSMEAVAAREADSFTTVSQVTAEEAEVNLCTRPLFVVYNGLERTVLPDFKSLRTKARRTRKTVLRAASRFLQKELPQATRLFATSGRYEFHNKGFDVLLESLAKLDQRLRQDADAPPVVAWFLLAAGHKGLADDFRKRLGEEGPLEFGPRGVATHKLHDEHADPIVQACQRLGLRNAKENKVNVIFTPAYLDGDDGIFNVPYYDILSAFDLGVFPSFYEPWGYTPLESIAYGVPTVTTDLAGFGRWAQGLEADHEMAVTIVNRAGRDDAAVAGDLVAVLQDFASMGDRFLEAVREKARGVAEAADWQEFFKGYLLAYQRAALQAKKRINTLDTSAFSDDLFISFKGAVGPGPHYRTFTVVPTLPPRIEGLREIAYNLWWSWHPAAEELFSEISQELWAESNHNPVRFLGSVSSALLEQKAEDKAFVLKYDRVLGDFRNYMNGAPRDFGVETTLSASSPIAYFSMEFCLHECLPIYSGGLGVLSGDHLKAASDLGIPFIGVGMFYRQGYFDQRIDQKGQQIEQYSFLDTSTLPASVVRDAAGKEFRVSVDIAGRQVFARAWLVQVGRAKLFLLDTDVDENSSPDRQICWQLYGGDRVTRIEQEILLGIGGVKLLEDALGLQPDVYHLNEGHCGFLIFDRIRRFMEKGLSFGEAREAVKATTVFTTHTPVPAGNEAFDLDVMKRYFTSFAPKLGITFEELVELGLARQGKGDEPFSMTVLALKLTNMANGVSRLHGQICRQMWRDVWKGVAVEEVPIGSITNGIHLTSWIGPNMRRLLSQYLYLRWDQNHDDPDAWLRVDEVPSDILWYEHLAQKKVLVDTIKKKIMSEYVRRGEDPQLIHDTISSLSPQALTIGFARRFATYKRATLLLEDRDTFVRLVSNPAQPVLVIFAGKAHPADAAGKDLIRQIIEESRSEDLRGKIIYLENYDMALGRLLTQGVDVWLNTPLRPHEASGTSGMKVVANGGLNCSILDGWWDEAFRPSCGFAIASAMAPLNREHQDEMDRIALMTLLEQKVIPLYYDRDDKGVPADWVAMMKAALKTIAPEFTTMRMVSEYYRKMYVPTAARGRALSDDDFIGIKSLTDWKRKLSARFSTVQVEQVTVKGLESDFLASNATLEVEVLVNPGRLEAGELRAELVIGLSDGERFTAEPKNIPFSVAEYAELPGQLSFHLSHRVQRSGSYMYALRLVPVHPLLAHTQETGLVRWL